MAYVLPFTLTNGTAADATQVMADLNLLLGAVNLQFAKDGSVAALGNFNLNGFKLTALTAGSGAGDSVEYAQWQASLAGLLTTAAAAATYLTIANAAANYAALASPALTGTPTINGINAGYLGAPINLQSGNKTLALTDIAQRLYSKNTGAQTITIPLNATVAFPVNDTIIPIINNGTTAMSIVPTGGVTLNWSPSGGTGTRTLAPKGTATLQKVETDVWFIGGGGLT